MKTVEDNWDNLLLSVPHPQWCRKMSMCYIIHMELQTYDNLTLIRHTYCRHVCVQPGHKGCHNSVLEAELGTPQCCHRQTGCEELCEECTSLKQNRERESKVCQWSRIYNVFFSSCVVSLTCFYTFKLRCRSLRSRPWHFFWEFLGF